MLPSSSMYISSIKLPWEEWFLCLERCRYAVTSNLWSCKSADNGKIVRRQRDKTLICTLEGSCNQRTVMKEEPPELFWRSESKMPTGSWSVRHHHIFSAFLKSFQPCLYTFIVKQRQVIRKCMCRRKKTRNVKVKASKKRHRTANHSLPLWFLRSMKEGSTRQTQIPNT